MPAALATGVTAWVLQPAHHFVQGLEGETGKEGPESKQGHTHTAFYGLKGWKVTSISHTILYTVF